MKEALAPEGAVIGEVFVRRLPESLPGMGKVHAAAGHAAALGDPGGEREPNGFRTTLMPTCEPGMK